MAAEAMAGTSVLDVEDAVRAANLSFNASYEADDEEEIYIGGELKYGVALTVVICIAYLAVFVVGVLGNVCVVMVVASFPRMRSTTNLFIANLAIADLLVNVLCLPFTLVSNVLQGKIFVHPGDVCSNDAMF